MERFGRVGLAVVAIAVLLGAFVPLMLVGLAPAEAAWIAMAASGAAFWLVAGRFVGRAAVSTESGRSAPRLGLGAAFLVVLGVALVIGGVDALWRVALALAPVAIVVSAYLFGRRPSAATS